MVTKREEQSFKEEYHREGSFLWLPAGSPMKYKKVSR